MIPASRRRVTTDPDADAYIAAVEAAGGSFDLTAINADYTESAVKQAHQDLFAGLKVDLVWDDIEELYLFTGKTWGTTAINVKAKGTGTLTNNNFVIGDYLAAGINAGVAGGNNKSFATGATLASGTNTSLGAYATVHGNAGDYILSTLEGGRHSLRLAPTTALWAYYLGAIAQITTDNGSAGYFLATRRSSSFSAGYKNGSEIVSDTVQRTIETPGSFSLMQAGNNTSFFTGTITAAHIGNGLSDTQVADLSTRLNAFMTALGCNVY